jgi:amino acid transporter
VSPGLKSVAWDWTFSFPNSGTWHWRVSQSQLLAIAVMAGITSLAYRRIEAAARLMVALWVGMLVTVAFVTLTGLAHFDARTAFDFPPGAWDVDRTFLAGLGGSLGIAMYAYLGYYQVCYIGDEVAEPARTIPRSVVISVVVIAAVYLTMNLSILGVIPWREVVRSEHVATDMMLRLHGPVAAWLMTLMIAWTALAATFSALLGYSRVPYAAASSGHFFRALAATHPKGEFPHR